MAATTFPVKTEPLHRILMKASTQTQNILCKTSNFTMNFICTRVIIIYLLSRADTVSVVFSRCQSNPRDWNCHTKIPCGLWKIIGVSHRYQTKSGANVWKRHFSIFHMFNVYILPTTNKCQKYIDLYNNIIILRCASISRTYLTNWLSYLQSGLMILYGLFSW